MIGTALVFALGALVASLAALLFAPFFWRRAERFARRRFEAEIPATVREMRGEVDGARARAAFEQRAAEMRAADVQARATRERAEAGRLVLENGALLRRQGELDAEIQEAGQRFEALERVLGDTRGERDEVLRDRERLRELFEKRGAEIERCGAEIAEMRERLALAQNRIAETERRRIATDRSLDPMQAPMSDTDPRPVPLQSDAAEPIATTASLPPSPVEPDRLPSGGARLRAAIAAGVSARTPAAPAENAAIRERISDMAARILRRKVDEGGAGSPVAAILARAPRDEPGTAAPSLAERVRRLAAPQPAGPIAEAAAPSIERADPLPPPPPAAGPLKDGEARGGGAGRSRRRSRR